MKLFDPVAPNRNTRYSGFDSLLRLISFFPLFVSISERHSDSNTTGSSTIYSSRLNFDSSSVLLSISGCIYAILRACSIVLFQVCASEPHSSSDLINSLAYLNYRTIYSLSTYWARLVYLSISNTVLSFSIPCPFSVICVFDSPISWICLAMNSSALSVLLPLLCEERLNYCYLSSNWVWLARLGETKLLSLIGF